MFMLTFTSPLFHLFQIHLHSHFHLSLFLLFRCCRLPPSVPLCSSLACLLSPVLPLFNSTPPSPLSRAFFVFLSTILLVSLSTHLSACSALLSFFFSLFFSPPLSFLCCASSVVSPIHHRNPVPALMCLPSPDSLTTSLLRLLRC
jgi:hypothetical protein